MRPSTLAYASFGSAVCIALEFHGGHPEAPSSFFCKFNHKGKKNVCKNIATYSLPNQEQCTFTSNMSIPNSYSSNTNQSRIVCLHRVSSTHTHAHSINPISHLPKVCVMLLSHNDFNHFPLPGHLKQLGDLHTKGLSAPPHQILNTTNSLVYRTKGRMACMHTFYTLFFVGRVV